MPCDGVYNSQAGACCSLSLNHGAQEVTGTLPHRFLVSTRGSSASHAVFGLEPPPSNASSTAVTEAEARLGGAGQTVVEEKEEGAALNTVLGLPSERGGWAEDERGGRLLSPYLSDFGSVASQHAASLGSLLRAEMWRRLPGSAQVCERAMCTLGDC